MEPPAATAAAVVPAIDDQQRQLEMRMKLPPTFESNISEYIALQAELAQIAETLVKPKKKRLEQLRSGLINDMDTAEIKRVRAASYGIVLSVRERQVEVKPKADDHLKNAERFFNGNTDMAQKVIDEIFKPVRTEHRATLVCKKDATGEPPAKKAKKQSVAKQVFQL